MLFLKYLILLIADLAVCVILLCAAVCVWATQFSLCNDKSIQSIPADIPAGTTSLYLKNNSISILGAAAFVNWAGLTIIDLRQNSMTTIDEDAFNGVASLVTLILRENHLTTIPFLHDAAQTLVALYLEANRIPILHIEEELPQLTTLVIYTNLLTGISDGTFLNVPSLTYLDVRYNANLPCFDLTHLASVLLSLHRASTNPSTVCYDELVKLSVAMDIFVENNNIAGHVVFPTMPEVRRLSLATNQITSIDFEPLPRLNELSLHNNHLTALPDFTNISSARIIILSNNLITTQSLNQSDLSPMSHLSLHLSGNPITRMIDLINVPAMSVLFLYLDGLALNGISNNLLHQTQISNLGLIIRGCGLFELPDIRGRQHPGLSTTVNIGTNQLTTFPPWLITYQGNMALNIDNNPLICDDSLCEAIVAGWPFSMDNFTCYIGDTSNLMHSTLITPEHLGCDGKRRSLVKPRGQHHLGIETVS